MSAGPTSTRTAAPLAHSGAATVARSISTVIWRYPAPPAACKYIGGAVRPPGNRDNASRTALGGVMGAATVAPAARPAAGGCPVENSDALGAR